MRYKAIDGQEITEEMINNWCSSYDKGEFPEGEYTVGKVVMGRPPLSVEGTTTLTVKVPIGMKETLNNKAEEKGITTSTYVRSILTNEILSA